ncbi:CaiB/BaiF CoA-transferase family protein [soil metagenome]
MASGAAKAGPLAGLKVVEFAGIGPGPMAAMLLADMGASVLRIDRTQSVDLGTRRPPRFDLLQRGKQSIALDLKSDSGRRAALAIAASSDALIEGFRPGVMERLGLGPKECHELNPRLVYGRMTGWGQTGPLAQAAGHDINYIAVTGALDAIGRAGQPPSIPLNVVGDFGGGSLYLAMGMLAALWSSQRTGKGDVIDGAVVDGTLSLMTLHYGSVAAGLFNAERGTNVIDSGAPYYDVYQCADNRWISIGPIEQRFYDELLNRMGFVPGEVPDRSDRARWPVIRQLFVDRFKTRTSAHWCSAMEGSECCFAPVLSMNDAHLHPHIEARNAIIEIDGIRQPAPAPRFEFNPLDKPQGPSQSTRDDALAMLESWVGEEQFGLLARQCVLDAIQGSQKA